VRDEMGSSNSSLWKPVVRSCMAWRRSRTCTRSLIWSLFVLISVAGCGSLSPAKPGQAENGPGPYSISTMYDGSLAGKEQASKWLDIDARNLCRSPYKLISEKTLSNVNHIGEVTSSRLVWTVTCEHPPEESS
jgi:hypothetical protein